MAGARSATRGSGSEEAVYRVCKARVQRKSALWGGLSRTFSFGLASWSSCWNSSFSLLRGWVRCGAQPRADCRHHSLAPPFASTPANHGQTTFAPPIPCKIKAYKLCICNIVDNADNGMVSAVASWTAVAKLGGDTAFAGRPFAGRHQATRTKRRHCHQDAKRLCAFPTDKSATFTDCRYRALCPALCAVSRRDHSTLPKSSAPSTRRSAQRMPLRMCCW